MNGDLEVAVNIDIFSHIYYIYTYIHIICVCVYSVYVCIW